MSGAFIAAREQVIAALETLSREDERIRALWLQGSLAGGEADPFSDVDAYLAIDDRVFQQVVPQREAILERLGGALAWSDAMQPGLVGVHALMAGGARLDLFFERLSTLGAAPRPRVKVLVDKASAASQLRTGWVPPTGQIARVVQTIVRMTRQGATWPLRLIGRGLWQVFAMVELDLINAQLAQLLALKRDPANFYRNPIAIQMTLDEAERARLAALTAEALEGLAARDVAAMKIVHLEVFDALVGEARAACRTLEVDYPLSREADAQVRALVAREWPTSIGLAEG